MKNQVEADLVFGHACFKKDVVPTNLPPEEILDEEKWVLLPYQTGEVRLYAEHIQSATYSALRNRSLLVFSGGRTRNPVHSEARSYSTTARRILYAMPEQDLIELEEGATTTFDNAMLSLWAIEERTGRMPKKIRAHNFGFKRERIEEHFAALQCPRGRLEIIDVNNPIDLRGAMAGEAKARTAYRQDHYGRTADIRLKSAQRSVGALTGIRQIRTPERWRDFVHFLEDEDTIGTEYPGIIDWG